MKKLIIYSPNALQAYGHSNDYVNGLISGFLQKGIKLSIVAFEGPQKLNNYVDIHTIRDNKLIHSRKRLGFLGNITWGISRIRSSLRLLELLFELQNKHKSSFILFESFEYISLALFVKKRRLNNYSCIFHDTNFNSKHSSIAAGIYKTVIKKWVRKIVSRCNTIYVHGSSMKKNFIETLKLKQSLHHKVKHIPYGAPEVIEEQLPTMSVSRKYLRLPNDAKILLCFGTLRKDKNFELLFQHFAVVKNWILLIAGPEGDLGYDAIFNLGKRYRCSENIITKNKFITKDEQPYYFCSCNIVVNYYMPYIKHESGTAQTARSFLKPLVAYGPEDLSNYINENNVGWNIEDPSVQHSLRHILANYSKMDKEEMGKINQSIKKCASERSWDNVCERILNNFR